MYILHRIYGTIQYIQYIYIFFFSTLFYIKTFFIKKEKMVLYLIFYHNIPKYNSFINIDLISYFLRITKFFLLNAGKRFNVN